MKEDLAMAFDGLFTRGMVHELNNNILGGRINKIHQPSQNELLFLIRANGRNQRLLISAHSSYARVQITNESIENPSEAPMFCMLLRKHLEGYTIEEIKQPDLERIIIFVIKGRNEIGDLCNKLLIVELMGKHSNVFLVDPERTMILDCLKHISLASNRVRILLPGQPYLAPPKQEKSNPLEADTTDLNQVNFTTIESERIIVERFAGLSPQFAKTLTDETAFITAMQKAKAHQYLPAIMQVAGKEVFYLWPFPKAQEVQQFESLSTLLDRFYFGKAERDRVKQQTQDFEKILQNEKQKNELKLSKLQKQLKDTDKADIYKKYGELLTANLHVITKGMKEAIVSDYYHELQPEIRIPLDVLRTPNGNAQHYFTKYQKLRKSVQYIHEQSKLAEAEISYLEGIQQQLSTASPKDLLEIREELEDEKYLRARTSKKKKVNRKPQLEKYSSSDGFEILVGKNNLQNEFLTMKLASKQQIWFHTKDIPGSHVVIQHETPSETAILEAATLAAYFSKARDSSNVAVDYTQIAHVKKPNGAKPGYVIYDHQKTIYVTPNKELVLELRK